MSAQPKFHIKRGDLWRSRRVMIPARPARCYRCSTKQRRAVVEGLNQIKKHMRKSQDNPKGGIVQKEAPIAMANLKLKEAGTAEKRAAKVKK